MRKSRSVNRSSASNRTAPFLVRLATYPTSAQGDREHHHPWGVHGVPWRLWCACACGHACCYGSRIFACRRTGPRARGSTRATRRVPNYHVRFSHISMKMLGLSTPTFGVALENIRPQLPLDVCLLTIMVGPGICEECTRDTTCDD